MSSSKSSKALLGFGPATGASENFLGVPPVVAEPVALAGYYIPALAVVVVVRIAELVGRLVAGHTVAVLLLVQ